MRPGATGLGSRAWVGSRLEVGVRARALSPPRFIFADFPNPKSSSDPVTHAENTPIGTWTVEKKAATSVRFEADASFRVWGLSLGLLNPKPSVWGFGF